jgi:hypothetical protein
MNCQICGAALPLIWRGDFEIYGSCRQPDCRDQRERDDAERRRYLDRALTLLSTLGEDVQPQPKKGH